MGWMHGSMGEKYFNTIRSLFAMGRLDEISHERLAEALEEVESKRATLRVVVGINYKQGISQTSLADWYGVSRTTIHNWLGRVERLATEPVEPALSDEDRPGRPPKLGWAERERVAVALRAPPTAVGLDATEWSPRLLQAFIEKDFDVEYSRRHARALLSGAGIEWTDTAVEGTDPERP